MLTLCGMVPLITRTPNLHHLTPPMCSPSWRCVYRLQKMTLEMWNVTSLAGEEAELVCEVEKSCHVIFNVVYPVAVGFVQKADYSLKWLPASRMAHVETNNNPYLHPHCQWARTEPVLLSGECTLTHSATGEKFQRDIVGIDFAHSLGSGTSTSLWTTSTMIIVPLGQWEQLTIKLLANSVYLSALLGTKTQYCVFFF